MASPSNGPSALLWLPFFILVAASAAGCKDSRRDSCAPGKRGCACTSALTCDSQLSCLDALCVQSRSWTLSFEGESVRACDVLLVSPDASRIESATFAANVQGQTSARGKRFAVSFVSRSGPLGHGAVALRGAGEAPAVAERACFDEDGAEVPGVEVSVQ